MTKEYVLAKALKKLMSNKTLEDINVRALTEICGVSRQTFYYHFRDIYDLLTWIYLHETIDGFENVTTWTEAMLKIGKYCQNNRRFVMQTYQSAGRDLLIEFITNRLFNFHFNALQTLTNTGTIEIKDQKRIAQFYAAATSAIILDWVRAGMDEPLTPLITDLQGHLGDYLTNIK